MNLLMAGMVPMMTLLRSLIAPTAGPDSPRFWFVMSMALLTGFIVAFPMNWWLVAYKLKHGMITVRRKDPADASTDKAMATSAAAHGGAAAMAPGMKHGKGTPVPAVPVMALVSFIALASGLAVALLAPAL